jgi:hypothetical protein
MRVPTLGWLVWIWAVLLALVAVWAALLLG